MHEVRLVPTVTTVHTADKNPNVPRFHHADDGATLTWCGREIAWVAVSSATVVDCRYCADRARCR